MAVVTEIGPDLFRISIYVPQFDLQFNHFLVKHEQAPSISTSRGDRRG